FNAAISSPWEARSDWDIFKLLAKGVSKMATELEMEPVKEVVATPLQHDSRQEMAQPLGAIKDWSKGECEPIPGKTMPQIHVIERDYKQIYDKFIGLGPNIKNSPYGIKGISWSAADEYEKLKHVL